MPSFHQDDLFRALAACEEVDLQVIFAKGLTSDRIRAGWQSNLTGYQYYFLNKRYSILDAVRLARSQRDRFHVVNGLWAEPSFAAALTVLALSGSSYAIYSEVPDRFKSLAPDPNLSKRSVVKELLKNPFGKILAPKAAGVLTVSHYAAEYFKSLGVSEQAIYPFGYFRSGSQLDINSHHSSDDNIVEVIYAGRFIRLKGLDLLLDAMLPLFDEYPNLFLTLIGSGEMLEPLREQVEALGVIDRVRFEGVIASDKIPSRLLSADIAVLPSRGDGWGMVVNEAFSVGVPVIASDRCGAADLVRNGVNGYVFRSEDASDLYNCLSDFLNKKSDWPRFRANAARTGSKISVEEVTPYLIECLKHMTGLSDERPAPPWTQLYAPQDANCLQ